MLEETSLAAVFQQLGGPFKTFGPFRAGFRKLHISRFRCKVFEEAFNGQRTGSFQLATATCPALRRKWTRFERGNDRRSRQGLVISQKRLFSTSRSATAGPSIRFASSQRYLAGRGEERKRRTFKVNYGLLGQSCFVPLYCIRRQLP